MRFNHNIRPTSVHPRHYATKAQKTMSDAHNQLFMLVENMKTAGCRMEDVEIMQTALRYAAQARDLLRSRM